MSAPSPLPHAARLHTIRRIAAAYRHCAERPAAYTAPAGLVPTPIETAVEMTPRALQRRYPLVSALLDELDLMDDSPPARPGGVRQR